MLTEFFGRLEVGRLFPTGSPSRIKQGSRPIVGRATLLHGGEYAVGPNQTHSAPRTTENYQHNRNFRPRVVKLTPRNIQHASYAQQTANRRSAGQTSFKQPQTANDDCRNCGLQHRQRECKAFGQQCHHCNKIGYFARACRSNRPATTI
jgi:hypothetical protein